ncbi:MAG: tetratricopeptide repeat protein [bacterium]
MTYFASLSRKAVVPALCLALLVAGCAGTKDVRKSAAGKTSREFADLPPRVLDRVISGSLFESQGDYLRALHEYSNALAYDSSQVELYVAIAEMHRQLGEMDLAEKVLDSGVSRLGPRPELLLPLGHIQYQNYEFDPALKTFEQYLSFDSTNTEVWAVLAAIYEHAKRYEDAIAVYERLETLEPESQELLLSREGSLYTRMERYDDALTVYRKLEAIRPEAHLVPFMIGGLYLDKGDTVKAYDAFMNATRLAPDEPRYWDLRIRIAVILGDSSAALTATDSALVFNPDELPLLSLASNIYLRYSQNDRAISVLVHAIELDSTNITNLVNLGYILHENQDWDKAESVYGRALALAPEDPQVLNNFAYMLAVSERHLPDALTYIQRALELQPENASYIDTKGWILFKMGKAQEALEVLQKAVDLDDSNPEILDHLGDVHAALGDREAAKRLWSAALEKGGDAEQLREKLNP